MDPANTGAVFYCYMIRCADGSYYIGVSEDPERRVQEHNEGKGSDWTAAHRPVKLVWIEEHPSIAAARTRENQLKGWSRQKKESLIGGSLRLRSGQSPSAYLRTLQLPPPPPIHRLLSNLLRRPHFSTSSIFCSKLVQGRRNLEYARKNQIISMLLILAAASVAACC